MTTISVSSGNGIYLTSASYTNPVVINPGVAITGDFRGSAIYANSEFWTITNGGTISGTGANVGGIYLGAGGVVTNQMNAVIGLPSSNSSDIYITGGAGSVTNAGTINAGVWLQTGGSVTNLTGGRIISGDPSGGYGVGLYAGGTVINAGKISGLLVGIDASQGGGTVTNQTGGTITGPYVGVLMGIAGKSGPGGRYLSNQAGGTISGDSGVIAGASSATVTNAGVITGTFAGTVSHGDITLVVGAGVSMSTGGAVTNQSGGTITGASYGVYITTGAGTVVNAGTISGSEGAVRLAAGQTDRLVVDPGRLFNGTVNGGNTIGASAVSTLELASGASAGTLFGLGPTVANFGSISFDTGADWFIAGNTAGLAGTISGFTGRDTIEVDGITVTGSSYAGGVLTLTDTTGFATLAITGDFTTSDFAVTNVTGGAEVNVACFRAGTRILTDRGEVAVEDLHVGDLVRTLLGDGAAPIIWVGRREVDCARHPQPQKVWPVRITAGAFGPGRPHSDVFLSPDHAVYVNEALIPVRCLINGSAIVQVPVDQVVYHHIELVEHEVLLAEGLPAESFLDMRDGTSYANRPGPARLYPDFSARMWEAFGCARLVVTGPELEAARVLVAGFEAEQEAA